MRQNAQPIAQPAWVETQSDHRLAPAALRIGTRTLSTRAPSRRHQAYFSVPSALLLRRSSSSAPTRAAAESFSRRLPGRFVIREKSLAPRA